MPETLPSYFSDLDLSEPLLRVLKELGYESPSPIQAATIPLLLSGRDVLGQAQTGTGKTAAFALPILSRIDLRQATPQALVLAPTRELAIQVAEAFQRYASHIPGFHVLPIYGGQSYGPQLSALRRGVHVIVGTPGRVIDHLDKGSLDLSQLKTLVLDEADEMLRMGFVEEVERILKETPSARQTALFSATLPSAIKRIAKTHLRNPAEITVAAKTGTADNIRQRYWLVSGLHKLDALTRILEAEPFDGMIIFVRTKLGTEELAGKLQARGFSAAAINGDLQQQQRERTIGQLKDGSIDILVATDVAARGLDVDRVSHVVNYDVPTDPESYTHRVGRTGRAGRSGEAILFITPRERGLLRAIERATRQPIGMLDLPSVQAVNDVRIARFKDQITETRAAGELELFESIIADYERENDVPVLEIAAALAKLSRGGVPLLLDKAKREPMEAERPAHSERSARTDRAARTESRERPVRATKERVPRAADPGMQTFRVEVGYAHGVKPGNIVGAIANEIKLDAKHIGRIEIFDDYSVVDLPEDLPGGAIDHLRTVWVAGQQLQIRHDGERSAPVKKAPRKTERTVAPAAERAVAPVAPVAPAAAAAPAPRVTAEPTRAPARPIAEEEAPAKAAATQSSKATDKPKTKPRTATFRIEVGREHGVTPAAIVAALAHDGGIDAKLVGRIELFDRFSLLDLPLGIPPDIARQLKTVRISGRPLRISQGGEMPPLPIKPSGKKAAPRKKDALRKKDAPRKKDGAAPPRKKKKI